MNVYFLLVLFTIKILSGGRSDEVVFQSQGLKDLNLTLLDEIEYINDDEGEPIEVNILTDKKGLLYWHRKLETPVCLTGECKVVNVGIYWYSTGEFMGLEVYGEQLTKTDHSVFSNEDYDQLITILQNDWSALREFEFEELLDEGQVDVDGVTGATRKEIANEAVQNAVYTTYTLWHLAHEGEKEQLRSLMAHRLNKGDNLLFEALSTDSNKRYQYFLLELYGLGKLKESTSINNLIFGGITDKDDRHLSELAYRSLTKVNFNDSIFQSNLAKVYPDILPKDKVRILNALDSGVNLTEGFYKSLILDLPTNNEWFAAKIIETIKNHQNQTIEIFKIVEKLTESKNNNVRRIALDFMDIHQAYKKE